MLGESEWEESEYGDQDGARGVNQKAKFEWEWYNR